MHKFQISVNYSSLQNPNQTLLNQNNHNILFSKHNNTTKNKLKEIQNSVHD